MVERHSLSGARRRALAVWVFGLFGLGGIAALAVPALGQANGVRVDFNRDVQPLLTQNCSICHGLDTNRRRAGLRLDNPESAFAKLPSGRFAIVPGDLKASELVERITARDAMQMPPADSGKKLTSAQIDTLKHWIAQGAKFMPHWAYVPPQRPALPKLKKRGVVPQPGRSLSDGPARA